MTIDDKIRDKQLKYDINREAAKTLALSSYLHCHQRRVIEQTNFTYSRLSKALEKQRKAPEDQGEKQAKTTEDQGEKQIKALDNRVEKFFQTQIKNQSLLYFSKDFLNEEATYELNKIVEMENKLYRKNLIYKTGNNKKDKTYDFQKFKTIRYFGRKIYNNDLLLDDHLKNK